MESWFIENGIMLSQVLACVALVVAIALGLKIKNADAGNERMHEIAGAIQEGAKAYLNRQVLTISVIAAILFVVIWYFKHSLTAIGFLVGAVLSLLAGY